MPKAFPLIVMVKARYVRWKRLILQVFVDIQGTLRNGDEVLPCYSAVSPVCETLKVPAKFLL
jgi:hypothetical protein